MWDFTCGERSPTRAIRATEPMGEDGGRTSGKEGEGESVADTEAAGACAVVMRIILRPPPTSAPTIVPAPSIRSTDGRAGAPL
ncbi:hypothetical protein VR44_32725 [Streptomyces katrae]|uniref:Uncharacterized protein n=1 Tax=Streptomyces katrae TaxID=68223 RepID=A0A0F4ITK9_9ACTN|nr:hypothetical protein VR44_32725 [Streptomyces katrae]